MIDVIKNNIKNQKGLSLVELLAVIVIIGIIAAIAIPSIGNIVEKSREKALITDAIAVLDASELYFMENPSEANATMYKLYRGGYISDFGSITGFSILKTSPKEFNEVFAIKGTSVISASSSVTSKVTRTKLVKALSDGAYTLSNGAHTMYKQNTTSEGYGSSYSITGNRIVLPN